MLEHGKRDQLMFKHTLLQITQDQTRCSNQHSLAFAIPHT